MRCECARYRGGGSAQRQREERSGAGRDPRGTRKRLARSLAAQRREQPTVDGVKPGADDREPTRSAREAVRGVTAEGRRRTV